MNRTIENGEEIDREADDDDLQDFPRETLMKMLQGDGQAEAEDTVAFGAGDVEDPAEPATVSVDDGLDLIEKAVKAKRAAADVPAEIPDTGTDEAAKGNDSGKADQAKDDGAPPAEADDLDSVLAGLDEGARGKVKDRVKAADEVMSIFKGRDAELQALGVTPHEAMRQLVEINSYARRNPGEYLAWAATQFGNPADLLGKAAERLGMKLVSAAPGADDDDPFIDPEVKELRARLAKYEQPQPQLLGPADPAHRAQQEIEAFAASRPDFNELAPHIAAMAQSQARTSGKPVSLQDIELFYAAAKTAFGKPESVPAATSAAQAPAPVKQMAQTKTAAAPAQASIDRAKAASRSLDGSGQGAGRRPALDPNASIEQTLSHLWEASQRG